MKLKNIFALATLGLSFVACDDIKENERFIPVTPEVKTAKNVLIEDFTGMNCINCPNAAEEIRKIQATYGAEKVIAVAIHGEMPGLSGPLANDLGTEYYKRWGVETLPIGMVDRQGLQNHTSWMAKVNERLTAQVAPFSLLLDKSVYNEDAHSITVQVEALTSADMTANLQLWITESNIESFQKMPSGSINMNYVHNHVLRDAVNGYWGESITLEAGVKQSVTYVYEIPDDKDWNVDNLAVVAFVYDESGVLQVNEKTFAEHDIPTPVVKPEFAFEYNGAALEDGATLTLKAQNGTAATLAEVLAVKNTGALAFSATATLEILEDVPGTAYTLNAFEATAEVAELTAVLEGEVGVGEMSFAGLSAVFAEGAYGTAKAKLTVTAGDVSKSINVNFVNPAPIAPELPFQLVYNGTVLEDGATLDINAIITDLTEFMPGYYIVEAKTNDEQNALNIHNLTGESLSATVNVEVLEDIAGTAYSLCSFGDCFPVNGGSGEKTGEIVAYGEAETGWDVTFTHGMTGTAKTKLTVTVGEETQTVYVNFVYN
ncbi:MAG: Omp28 family outer membrane lipoprotein [Bacteroidaceae bacterium]|nr:Omp28 family outer membrane lipoprotein [Bacteroidaceae bacterium]